MPQIGGYIPGYNVRLQVSEREPHVISSADIDVDTNNELDAVVTTTTSTDPTLGSQYLLDVVPVLGAQVNEPPAITITSSNPSVATVSSNGRSTYVSNGAFEFVVNIAAYRWDPAKTLYAEAVNTTTTPTSSTSTTITPNPVTAEDHVLVVWNTSSSDSVTVKDYYVANRPGFGDVNTLGLTCPTTERCTETEFNTQIRDPILDHIAYLEKPIRYIVLILGIPTRLSTPNTSWTGNSSVQYLLYSSMLALGLRTGPEYRRLISEVNRFSLWQYPGVTALVTSINMGSVANCQAYIDKLAGRAGTKLSGTIIGTEGTYGGGMTRDKVFDGSLATYFDAPAPGTDTWVGLDLGSPVCVTRIRYAPRESWTSRMVGCKFQASASADFSSGVVDLHTISSPQEGFNTVELNGTHPYRYYRYLSVGMNYGNVAEVEFYSELEPTASATGHHGNGGYYIDQYQAAYTSRNLGTQITDAIRTVNETVPITVADDARLTAAHDVRGYLCWGGNGGMGGNYANDGSVVFTGDSNWYLIQTIESFNGQLATGQGNYVDWFSANAFGGTSYSNTPVGAVTHVDEPTLGGVNDTTYWTLWERGYNLAECGWYSRSTPKLQVVGDPLVKR